MTRGRTKTRSVGGFSIIEFIAAATGLAVFAVLLIMAAGGIPGAPQTVIRYACEGSICTASNITIPSSVGTADLDPTGGLQPAPPPSPATVLNNMMESYREVTMNIDTGAFICRGKWAKSGHSCIA